MPFLQFGACKRSPMDRLPLELLSHIFALSTHGPLLQGENREGFTFASESVTVPLTIASVCHQWRQVALGTASLWTSICVTTDFVLGKDDPTSGQLDTAHLVTYLTLSRRAPLDIMIDARDPSWDFSESGVTPTSTSYVPPFQPAHMECAMELLLPHLARWRTVTILTDTWLIMHSALALMTPPLMTHGAPQLQSLSLLRCNDFVSFSSDFRPRHLKDSPFLATIPGSAPSAPAGGVFPRLRHLVMQGVHARWDALPSLLSSQCLETLELSSHSFQVRPSVDEFSNILSSCRHLRKLVVDGSGFSDPILYDEADDAWEGVRRSASQTRRIALPNLEEIFLGYRSAQEACRLLDLLDAPNVKTLTLRNAAHPLSTDAVNEGQLLLYVATGVSKISDILPPGTSLPLPSENALSPPMPLEIAEPTLPFPALESVTLEKVVASELHFHMFFKGLKSVKHMAITRATPHSVRALVPRLPVISGPTQTASFPCPHLEVLTLRVADSDALGDLALASPGGLLLGRAAARLPAPKKVDVHLETRTKCLGIDADHMQICIARTPVTIYQPNDLDLLSDVDMEDSDEDEQDSLEWMDTDLEESILSSGGQFNHIPFASSFPLPGLDVGQVLVR